MNLPDRRDGDAVPAEHGDPAGEFLRATEELDRLTVEAEELAAELDGGEAERDPSGQEPEGGLPAVRAGGGRTPARAKAEMARLRSAVKRKQEEIAAKSAEVKKLMEARLRRAQATLAPLQAMARRLEEGIWTVNLYLGRDEEIRTLRGGEPAEASEPITVRQLVLAMDQECAVAAEEGGIDAVDIEEFDEWLLADPAHVEQVIPEKKGVVALVPRFGAKDYGDPWKTTAVAKANEQTYFLIRNGERLYRTWTDFNVGRTLVPARDEFTSFFEETRHEWAEPLGPHRRVNHVKVPLEPGSLAWQRAEEKADARRRHFMRAALILQGLLERTTVFHPLPEDELGVGFLDERHYFADRVRIVMDAEPALTAAGHEGFREWQRRLNALLRVGMRIVGNFRGDGWRYANAGDEGPESRRLYPALASPPTTGEVYGIEERRRGGALVFRYEREDEVYDPDAWRDDPKNPGWGWRGEWRKPKTRASCTVYPEDRFLIPFDLAEAADMERYLRSRTERGEYLTMFPVLKAAIAAKRTEAAAEEPFRRMLAGVLARENGVGVDEAADDVPDLVWWYKLANRRHRPLVGDEAAEDGRAVRAIVAEHARRVRERDRERRRRVQEGPEGEIVARLLGLHPDAIVVARKRDASWVVLTPERPSEAPDPDVFAAEHEYGAREASRPKGETPVPRPGFPKRWVIPGSRPARANWKILHAAERWEGWELGASHSEHLSDPEREALAREIAEGISAEKLMYVFYVAEGEYGREPDRRFGVWTFDREAHAACATGEEERPLTGGYLRGPEVGHRTYRWRRGPDRRPYLEAPSHEWSRTIRHDGRPPGVVLVEGAVEAYEAAEDCHREAEERRRTLASRAYSALHAIEEAWRERAEREEYRRFMEDYADPELWEGHKKTLRISYPHGRGGLGRLVERLVEEGIEVGGLSVAEASDLAKERGVGAGFKAPEDIADLRFPDEGEDA